MVNLYSTTSKESTMKALVISALGIKSKSVILISLSVSTLYLIFDFITDNIDKFIFQPWWTLIFLWFLIFADYFTGVKVAIKRDQGFSSKKGMLSIYKVINYTFLLGVVNTFPKINAKLGLDKAGILLESLPKVLFVYICSVLLMSYLKNAVILDWIDGKVAEFIYKYIDVYKNNELDKLYVKKDEKD